MYMHRKLFPATIQTGKINITTLFMHNNINTKNKHKNNSHARNNINYIN